MFKTKKKTTKTTFVRSKVEKYSPEVILTVDIADRSGYARDTSIRYTHSDYINAIQEGIKIIEQYIPYCIGNEELSKAMAACEVLKTYFFELQRGIIKSTVDNKKIAGAEALAVMLFNA